MSTTPYFHDASLLDSDRLLSIWFWYLRKPYRLLGSSSFGDLFLETANGPISMLDLTAGELRQIAVCREEFEWGLTDADRSNEWLMHDLARQAEISGLVARSDQCLAFQTPPMLGGTLSKENLVVWNLYLYHEGLAKLYPQLGRPD